MDTVRVVGGGPPVYFNWALPGQAPVLSTTATGYSAPMPKDGVYCSIQASVRATSGAASATVTLSVTNSPHAAGADNTVTGERNNFTIITTSGSPTISSPEGLFRANMDGDEVYAIGVPAGVTMSYVSATSATLSSNATASSGTVGVQARFQCLSEWCSTLLGTITLGSATPGSADGIATSATWKWIRARVTLLAGNGSAVKIIQVS